MKKLKGGMTNWQVSTAAEAIAAAQFARFGFDVSVQYGANQPEYDLMIARSDQVLKVSVKGSKNGGWGLSQSQLAALRKADRKGKTDYHAAADKWGAKHFPRTVVCFVQFKDVKDDEMPRVYLARPKEVVDRLKLASGGRGDTILWESYKRGPKAAGAGTTEQIPDRWRLTLDRVQTLLRET
jgi:hypothetical protein